MHRWALSLDRGECTAISTSNGQLRIELEGTIFCLDLETGAILQELQVRVRFMRFMVLNMGCFTALGIKPCAGRMVCCGRRQVRLHQ